MNNSVFIGFDYSLKLPAMCICDMVDGQFNIENCSFFYSTVDKKWQNKTFINSKFYGYDNLDNKSKPLDRYLHVSNAFLNEVDDIDDISDKELYFSVEDYAFSQSGQLATLGEHTGVLKYRIYNEFSSDTVAFSPTTIKSFARTFLPENEQTFINDKKKVNKTKMTKEIMHNAFKNHTGVDLCKVFDVESVLTKSGKTTVKNNPIADIVDAYFITLYHYTQTKGK